MPVVETRKLWVDLSCHQCGKSFKRRGCQISANNRPNSGRFCSRECLSESRRRVLKIPCTKCGKIVRRWPSEVSKNGRGTFCSRECLQLYFNDSRKPHVYPKQGGRHAHRSAAETALGRALRPREVVHHIDENKQNFSPENLAVFPMQALHVAWHAGKMSEEQFNEYRLVKGAACSL